MGGLLEVVNGLSGSGFKASSNPVPNLFGTKLPVAHIYGNETRPLVPNIWELEDEGKVLLLRLDDPL